jgi:hypothetical protein
MMTAVLELRLRSGQVVAFDGRVVEVFAANGSSCRLHIVQLSPAGSVASTDGGSTLALGDCTVVLSFAREEAPACARLLAALGEARAAHERLESR